MKRALQIAVGLLLALALQGVAGAQTATVMTDKADYAPGTIVTITGSGWQPGETVTLSFVESPLYDTHPHLYATADDNGNIFNNQFSPDVHDENIGFTLTATGQTSGLQAQTTFTDAPPVKLFEASITPTSDTAGHVASAYSIKITNDPTSTNDISSATINVPTGYTSVTLGTVTTSPAGLNWTAVLASGVITITANAGPDHITAGQSITLALTATAPCTAGASVWTTATSGSFAIVGSQPTVTITGTCTARRRGQTIIAALLPLQWETVWAE